MNGDDLANPVKYLFGQEFCIAGGLTKRELIAAMAMKGMLANSRFDQGLRLVAEGATQYADALIERLSADPVAEGLNSLPMYSRELDEGLKDGE
jgi:hypothetical protein